MYDLIVIGGGAAGIFGAISAKLAHPSSQVILLEKSAVLLSKVRISGGGRCNVTHSCFDPKLLIQHYPRGSKELLGPFHHFQPRDTIQWFESRGVKLKTERDGRIFPVTDSSLTIIECLLSEASNLGIKIYLKQQIKEISKNDLFEILLQDGTVYLGKHLLLATGNSSQGHEWAKGLGHSITTIAPSLFTFNVPSSTLKTLSGISLESVELQIEKSSLIQKGPLLITHFGFSGPAVLKLSAWGARYFQEKDYHVDLIINWIPQFSQEELFQKLSSLKSDFPQKTLLSENIFGLPKNLWKAFLEILGDSFKKRLSDTSIQNLRSLAQKIHADKYRVEGKTTHKEEFVTCGGVNLKEIDFKTMESKLCKGLFFAGEILDIDGVTGGFNFQNAWTTSYIAGTCSLDS